VTNNHQGFAQLRRRSDDWLDLIAAHLQQIRKDAEQITDKRTQIFIMQRAHDLLSLITKTEAHGAQSDQLLTPLLLGPLDLKRTQAKARFGADSPEERRSSEVLLRVAEQLHRWGRTKGWAALSIHNRGQTDE
jgi:hypothetical protein